MTDDRALNAVTGALDLYCASLTPTLPGDMSAFIKQRVELARTVNEFLAGERQDAVDPIQRLVSDVREADRQRLYRDLVALRMTYSAHISRWDTRTITASWEDYRRDAIALVDGMRRLLDARNRLRLPHAA